MKGLERVSMQNQPTAKNKKFDIEQLFDLFMLLVVVFEVILLTVVLLRSYPRSDAPEPPSDREEQTTDAPPPVEEPVSTPVFAGGTVPTLPSVSADTRTLAGEIDSQFAMLVDLETGVILAQRNAETRFSPASMTKVMTLVVACERLYDTDLTRRVTMTDEIERYVTSGNYKGTSRATFDVGEVVTIRDLLYGVGVQSFSDCTVMLVSAICPADTVEQSEKNFVALMNQRAREMGLVNTNFDNVVGYESEQNYTTATEMAAIMMYALECPLIKDILSAPKHEFYVGYKDNGVDKEYRVTYYSTLFNANPQGNSRIKAYEQKYGKRFALAKGVFGGGKTGTLDGTSGAAYKYSLVSYAMINERIYVVVTAETTQSHAVMNDAKFLYDNCIK